jgi:hypothetical protein
VSIRVTDDEVVAIAVEGGVVWQAQLPSLEPRAEVLTAAHLRGVRSLLVRDIAAVADGAVVIHPDVSETIRQVATADSWAVAYVASDDSQGTISGNATYHFASDGGSDCIVDVVSPTGIHELIRTSAENGNEILKALARNVDSVQVRQGAITRGVLGPSGEFIASVSVSDWEDDVLKTVLTAESSRA